MERLTENKIVLIVRETRLEELKARFNTVSQARFYVEQQGGDFADYERENDAYQQAITLAQQNLSPLGRLQIVHRSFLPNFIFGPEDVVVAVGQDGLVANTLKYLNGQPLVGVNPEPSRYDGKLLPFQAEDLSKIIPEVIRRKRPINSVTMAKASLNNGQILYAVNDLFIGPKSHGSARYTLHHGYRSERHSSSGVIVSTGMGATGWFSSLVAGANGLLSGSDTPRTAVRAPFPLLKWDSRNLVFTVREPFPSRTTGVDLVFGEIREDLSLTIDSLMPERGVIFSDGIESDFLEFNSGTKAEIGIAERQGRLVA